MASWLASFFTGEYEGKALQRSGPLTREQLVQWFEAGKQLFASPDFKMALLQGYQRGQSVQNLINQAQARIWEEKVEPPVQGDYGLGCLAGVQQQFKNDAELLRMFFEFVQLEERALDEAEMPAAEFEAKYAQLEAMKKQMEAKMKEHEAAMAGMSDEEKQKYMMEVQKAMVNATLGGPSCCSGGSCSAGVHSVTPNAPPTQAPPGSGNMDMQR